MRALIVLLFSLPWWGSLLVIVGLVAAAYALGWYFKYKFHKICREAVLEAGAALKDAQVTVHSVVPVPLPSSASPYDIKSDDEDFVEGVDDEPWDDKDANYYEIDVTIAPAMEGATWDPTGLALVPADYVPDDEIEITEKICPLHSAEIFVNGRFQPARETDVRGSQRLKMVFAVHDGLHAVKFGMVVTYFGHVELPAPLPKASQAPKPRKAAFKW